MTRINVYETADNLYEGEKPSLLGWFNPDNCTRIAENREFNGQNMVSVVTEGEFEHECLYRTKSGRWILEHWSQWQGSKTTYRFLDDHEVRDWLLRNGSDDEVEKYFGAIADESGPNVGGRPEVGGKIGSLAIGDDLLVEVDRYQAARGFSSRAAAIRNLIAAGLEADAGEAAERARA